MLMDQDQLLAESLLDRLIRMNQTELWDFETESDKPICVLELEKSRLKRINSYADISLDYKKLIKIA